MAGLKDLKKTINIKGIPHNLAWVNSKEEAVMKAMGGSGKNRKGFPSYEINEDAGAYGDMSKDDIASEMAGESVGGEGDWTDEELGLLEDDEYDAFNDAMSNYGIDNSEARAAAFDAFSKGAAFDGYGVGGENVEEAAQQAAQEARDAIDAAQAAKDAAAWSKDEDNLLDPESRYQTKGKDRTAPSITDFFSARTEGHNAWEDLMAKSAPRGTEAYIEWNKRPALPADEKGNPIGRHVKGPAGWEVAYKDLDEVKKAFGSDYVADFKPKGGIGSLPTGSITKSYKGQPGIVDLIAGGTRTGIVKDVAKSVAAVVGADVGDWLKNTVDVATGFLSLPFKVAADFWDRATAAQKKEFNVPKEKQKELEAHNKMVAYKQEQDLINRGKIAFQPLDETPIKGLAAIEATRNQLASDTREAVDEARAARDRRDANLAATRDQLESDTREKVDEARVDRDRRDANLAKTVAQNWQDYQAKVAASKARHEKATREQREEDTLKAVDKARAARNERQQKAYGATASLTGMEGGAAGLYDAFPEARKSLDLLTGSRYDTGEKHDVYTKPTTGLEEGLQQLRNQIARRDERKSDTAGAVFADIEKRDQKRAKDDLIREATVEPYRDTPYFDTPPIPAAVKAEMVNKNDYQKDVFKNEGGMENTTIYEDITNQGINKGRAIGPGIQIEKDNQPNIQNINALREATQIVSGGQKEFNLQGVLQGEPLDPEVIKEAFNIISTRHYDKAVEAVNKNDLPAEVIEIAAKKALGELNYMTGDLFTAMPAAAKALAEGDFTTAIYELQTNARGDGPSLLSVQVPGRLQSIIGKLKEAQDKFGKTDKPWPDQRLKGGGGIDTALSTLIKRAFGGHTDPSRYRQAGGPVEEKSLTLPPIPDPLPPIPKPEPEEEITGSPLEKYFKRKEKQPVREPNTYLMELMNRIRPGREAEDQKRRLGWQPKEIEEPVTTPLPPIMDWDNPDRALDDYQDLSYEDAMKKYERDEKLWYDEYGRDYGDQGWQGTDHAGWPTGRPRRPPMKYADFREKYWQDV